MAKTQLTRDIEAALHAWHPSSYGGYRVDSFRQGFDAIEVPVECGSVKSGLVDFVRVQECFTSKTKYGTCKLASLIETDTDVAPAVIQEKAKAATCVKNISSPDFCSELFRAMVPLPQDESSVYARCRHHLCGNQDFCERFPFRAWAQFCRTLQLLCDAH